MARYGKAMRAAEHSGKSGYIATKNVGSPKPLPYGVIEEYATGFYPQYREFIPQRIRKFSDSAYDLRTQKYKYWYDKWGKPHINKWWQSQLDATLRIQKAYETYKKPKNVKYNPRSINYGSNNGSKYSKYNLLRGKHSGCRCICDHGKTRYRQRPRSFKRRKSRFY